MEEIFFDYYGKKIAAKNWHPHNKVPVLALHGWLDNAASFDKLAPLLENYHIVAIDLPGHGHSYHEPKGATFHLVDYVVMMIQLVTQLKWDRFILLGHSLGAALATLIAGTIPERILGVALIDALGPFSAPPERCPQQLRKFIEETLAKPNKMSPRFKSQEEALNLRLKTNKIRPPAAKIIVERGTQMLPSGEWIWRTDPRLLMPLAIQLTEEQVLAFLKAITAPVRLVLPEHGFPYEPHIMKKRYETISNIEMVSFPGTHHVHLDHPELVADYFKMFFEKLRENF